jgi:hypothetical protein
MTDIEKAQKLFEEAGLGFPTVPGELAVRLKERGEWQFSTRKVDMWPYNLHEYVREVDDRHVRDYALLCHSGHGFNSYAIQYYLVHGALRMFLHFAWGGAFMDNAVAAAGIRECFSLADRVVAAANGAARGTEARC